MAILIFSGAFVVGALVAGALVVGAFVVGDLVVGAGVVPELQAARSPIIMITTVKNEMNLAHLLMTFPPHF
jgi:hypothetical protein